jgi:hypothetical protein
VVIIIIIIIIQSNSVLIYLRANLTAQKPTTKLALVRITKLQQRTYTQNKKQGSLYSINNSIVIILIVIIKIIQFLTAQQPKGQC